MGNIKNNNNKIIRKITLRSIKTNKLRNIVAILAICMTTFMITAIFSLGYSVYKGYPIMNNRQQGTTASISLNYPTDEQIEAINSLEFVESSGILIKAGRVDNKELEQIGGGIDLVYYDKNNYEKQYVPCIDEIVGSYPTERKEIMLPKNTARILGLENPQIGDKIALDVKLSGEVYPEEFIISGVFNDFNSSEKYGTILVSESFTDSYGLTNENKGVLQITLKQKYKGSKDVPTQLENAVTLNGGQLFKYNYDLNSDASGVKLVMITVSLILVGFVIACGFLLIYNIMQISVIRDINFYGLIKTIGASPKQIKQIVKYQTYYLSIIGISIGLILGSLVSNVIVPMFTATLYTYNSSTSLFPEISAFNPWVYLFTITFSFLCVVISCRKPAKIAGSISPIEAEKYTGIKKKKVKKARNSTNGSKIYKMAWYNIFNVKSKAILVMASLFMGVITFLLIRTFLGSMTVENYLNAYTFSDFTLYNSALNNTSVEDKLTAEVIDEITRLDGVDSYTVTRDGYVNVEPNDATKQAYYNRYETFNYTEEETTEVYKLYEDNYKKALYPIVTLEDEYIQKVYDKNPIFDIEGYRNGEVALVADYYGIDFDGTQTIKMISKDEINGEIVEKEIRVQSVKDRALFSNLGSTFGAFDICVNNEVFDEIASDVMYSKINIDCDPDQEVALKKELIKMSSEYNLSVDSRSDIGLFFTQSMTTYNVIGSTFCITLILIGIVNFINVIITSINARNREFALMESIGMTKKQIIKLVTYEGLYYTGITCGLLLTLGSIIINYMAKWSLIVIDYGVYYYPLKELIFVVSIIFLVCLITPFITYKQLSKDSITDRIRVKN